MRTAIVHYWLLGMRGGERVVEALCRMLPDADVFTLFYDPSRVSPDIREHRVTASYLNPARRWYRALLPLMPSALERFDLRAYDLVISSESGPAKGVLTRADARHICYCHTPMRYLWELYPEYAERWAGGVAGRAAFRICAHYLRMWDYASAARVDDFVANSENVRRRIWKTYRREARVVHPPVATSAFRWEPERDYFLIVSELVGYKRIDTAVRVFNASGRRLDIVGDGPEYRNLRRIAGPNVRFHGRLDDGDVRALYARCRAFLMPGEEDFGITAVEALASGKPVIAFGRGGVLETVPPFGGVLYDDASFLRRCRHGPRASTSARSPSACGASSSPAARAAPLFPCLSAEGLRPTGGLVSKKVVFFFPAFSSQEATAPLGILAVSTPLLRAGYQVRIIDSTITPNFQQRVLEELSDALCLAISLVTGPMIRETVAIARAAKTMYPGLPVVLGGWHPSLLPHQTLAAEFVDVVVVGQGEDAFLEVVQRIEAGESLAGVAGVGYKADGEIVFNARRPLRPIAEMPPKAYHLADFDAYERVCGRRWAMYTSSLACPYSCSYCTNEGVYGRKWNALPAEQASDEMCDLVSRYGLELLWVVDDNFLVDRERALGIAEGICRRGVSFDWSIQGSTNLVTRFSVDEWKLLRRSGLSQVSQGADSGSPKVMRLMNKTFQKLETVYQAAELLTAAGVRPSFNMIFGFPGEGRAERRESVRLIMNICRRYPGAEFWTNIFTPYPGAPVMERAFELGIETPTTFEGWSDFFPRYTVLPWLKGRDHKRVQRMRDYLRVAFNRVPIGRSKKHPVARLVHEWIAAPARFRLDHDFYAAPFELWAKDAAARLFQPPKAKVDAHQLSAEVVSC